MEGLFYLQKYGIGGPEFGIKEESVTERGRQLFHACPWSRGDLLCTPATDWPARIGTISWTVFHTEKPYLGQCFTRESHILVSVSHGKAISWSVFHTEKPYLGQCFTREGRLLLPTTALGPSTIRTIDWAKNILIWLFNYKTYEDHLNNSFTKFKTWI